MTTTPTLKTYSFTIILAGVSEITVDMADALYGSGCDDAGVGSCEGIVTVDFDREAESLGAAVGSAIADIERARYRVARVEIEEAIIAK